MLRSAISGNTGEVGTRASLYLFSLSSSLVALGFASRSPELFGPFVAIVLPALFILGLFTAVRLVDSNLEACSIVAMLAGGLLREKRTVVASLIGAGVALLLMACFFVYQKWRYDSTTGHMPEQDKRSGGR